MDEAAAAVQDRDAEVGEAGVCLSVRDERCLGGMKLGLSAVGVSCALWAVPFGAASLKGGLATSEGMSALAEGLPVALSLCAAAAAAAIHDDPESF